MERRGRLKLSLCLPPRIVDSPDTQHCFLRCSNLHHFVEYLCVVVVVLKCDADRQIGVNTQVYLTKALKKYGSFQERTLIALEFFNW